MNTIIKGTGSELAGKLVKNADFIHHEFYDATGKKNEKSTSEIIQKLESITGIRERRYVRDGEDSVPLMLAAATKAIANAGIQINDLQGIIVSHNAGNMLCEPHGTFHQIPNVAALLKNALQCSNYECFAYDILFGCPGWLQGIIQAKQAIQAGEAEHILVVGVEVASRFLDPHDLDSMILADGCGACVVSKSDVVSEEGILSHATFSHAQEDLMYIHLGASNVKSLPGSAFFKMKGRDVYKYATQWVPKVIKKALDKAGKNITDVDMFLFHQANGKMLAAIANNIAALYGEPTMSFDGKIPSTIEFLGNTSVATIPTLLDLIRTNQLEGYEIKKGQLVVFASVGAGMHCNALVYQF